MVLIIFLPVNVGCNHFHCDAMSLVLDKPVTNNCGEIVSNLSLSLKCESDGISTFNINKVYRNYNSLKEVRVDTPLLSPFSNNLTIDELFWSNSTIICLVCLS